MDNDDAKSRIRRIVGDEGIARLDGACVAVFGLGGVGSNCAEALVRGGVGALICVDGDTVAPSNINRQAIAFVSTVGRPKADVMAAMARDINPEVRVFPSVSFIRDEGDIARVLEGCPTPTYIVDAVDTVAAKLALAHYAQEHDIPLIASMGGANKLDPTKLAFADLFETQNCPLCRAMRKAARERGIDHLHVLYSCEQPVKVAESPDAKRYERTELGTMSYFPPIMGQLLASYVLRSILNL